MYLERCFDAACSIEKLWIDPFGRLSRYLGCACRRDIFLAQGKSYTFHLSFPPNFPGHNVFASPALEELYSENSGHQKFDDDRIEKTFVRPPVTKKKELAWDGVDIDGETSVSRRDLCGLAVLEFLAC